MGLKDIGETLPAGFRFNPSDEELVCHYLYKKIANEEVLKGTLVEIDLHSIEPWQLPEVAKLNSNEWYFFSFRDRKYATGLRTNRATTTGYWKATGKDRVILDPKTRLTVGMRKTLVFYRTRAPNGVKTPWIMHEFRLETPNMPPKEDWVLCRVFHKGKGESNTHPNLHTFETLASATATSSSPPPFADERTRASTFGYQGLTDRLSSQIQILTGQNPNALSPTLFNPIAHLPQLLKQGDSSMNDMMIDSSKNDITHDDQAHEADQYAFLWDMAIDGTSLGHGTHHGHHHHHHHSEFGDMGFEDGNGIVLFKFIC